jgi:transposase
VIQLTPQMRILLAVQPVDFRKGIDGLAAVCRSVIKTDPFGGFIFVFRNRRKTTIKLLTYDGQGFWLFQKRLSTGRFRWWPEHEEQRVRVLAVHELQLLIWNGDPSSARVEGMWRRIESGRHREIERKI